MKRFPIALAVAVLAGCTMPPKPPAQTASAAAPACKHQHDFDMTGSHISGSSTCNDGSVRTMSADSLAHQSGGGSVGGGGR